MKRISLFILIVCILSPFFLLGDVPIIGDLTGKAEEFISEFKELGYVIATGTMIAGVIAVILQKKIGWAMIIAGFIGNMALYRITDISDFAR